MQNKVGRQSSTAEIPRVPFETFCFFKAGLYPLTDELLMSYLKPPFNQPFIIFSPTFVVRLYATVIPTTIVFAFHDC